MAAYSATHRIIRIPNAFGGIAGNVRADILATVKPYGATIEEISGGATLRIEIVLSSAQDTTLVGLMGGWATRLGLANLDTTAVTVQAGH